MEKVSVIIPAYNEQGIISDVIKRVKTIKEINEIIVVDDGSSDKTYQVLKKIKRIKVLCHPYNIGNGAAVKTGIRAASGDIIVTMDGDGQHSPSDISRLVKKISKGYDMVVGARSAQSETARYRNLGNFFYNLLATYVTKFPIKDLTSGMRAVKAKFAKSIVYLLPNSFSYPTTMTLALIRSGRSLTYISIKTKKRTGKSKIKVLEDGIRFLMIIMKIATLFSPMRVFLPVSGLFFLSGAIYSAITLIYIHRFTNMGMLLIAAAIIIFMIGLVSEQVSQLRMDRSESED